MRRRRRPRSSLSASAQQSPEADVVSPSSEVSEVVSVASEEVVQVSIATTRRSSDDSPRSRRRHSGCASATAPAVPKISDGLIEPFAPSSKEKSGLVSDARAASAPPLASSVAPAIFEAAANRSERGDSPLLGGSRASASVPDRQPNGFGPSVGEPLFSRRPRPASAAGPASALTSASGSTKSQDSETLSAELTPTEDTPQLIKVTPVLVSAAPTISNDRAPDTKEPVAPKEIVVVAETSALTKEPSTVITEASAVTSKAPSIISEASALTNEASNLIKEVPTVKGPTPAIIRKAPALISEAKALIKEAEAIQNAVPSLTNEGSDASDFNVEAPELISKAPALFSEASALIKEAQALINQVPEHHQLPEKIKANLVKNGDIVPNPLEDYIAVASKVLPEQNIIHQEEISSTNSTLAGVDDFDTFELASEREDITKGTDYRVISRIESEVRPVSIELVNKVSNTHKGEQTIRLSEVSPREDRANKTLGVDLICEGKRKVELQKTRDACERKSNAQERQVEAEYFGEVENTIVNVKLRTEKDFVSAEGEISRQVKESKIDQEVLVVSKNSPFPAQGEETDVNNTDLLVPLPVTTEALTTPNIEAAGCKTEGTPSDRESITVKNEKLVAPSSPTKSKRKKKAKSKIIDTVLITTKDVDEFSSVPKEKVATCESKAGSKKAVPEAEELVFPSLVAEELEVSALVGAGEGVVASPEVVANARHPRTDGEILEVEKEIKPQLQLHQQSGPPSKQKSDLQSKQKSEVQSKQKSQQSELQSKQKSQQSGLQSKQKSQEPSEVQSKQKSQQPSEIQSKQKSQQQSGLQSKEKSHQPLEVQSKEKSQQPSELQSKQKSLQQSGLQSKETSQQHLELKSKQLSELQSKQKTQQQSEQKTQQQAEQLKEKSELQSQQQPQGEVPAHELARLLGQLRGVALSPQTGDEMPPAPGDGPAAGAPAAAASAAASVPVPVPVPVPAPRPVPSDEESATMRTRKDGVAAAAATVGSGGADATTVAGQRDSANHSPAEGMLASPRAHDICSNFSGDEGDEEEGDSSDSGKGCSDAPTPPPSRTPASGSSVSGDVPLATSSSAPDAAVSAEDDPSAAAAGHAAAATTAATAASGARVYEFVLPQHLVGRLIGRHGCFVHQIKARTNASILIKRHPDTVRLKVCAVEGSPTDVDGALEMIRQKFPEKRYPNVSLEQVCFVSPALPVVPVLPDCLRLQLVEGISNDVILSSLVSPAHFFLQQPTHPTFPALARLCGCMDATYGGDLDTPVVPAVQAGIVVAAPVAGSWYRAEVVAAELDADTCQVRYVDYGGYEVQQNSALRQIRSDFMTLPFQAAECYLANVMCNSEEEGWSTEALSAVDQLTAGQVLQAQVCGYCEDGVPAVSLYAVSGSQVVSVSQELVARGLAQWWEPSEG